MNDILNIISSSSDGNCYIYNNDIMLDIGVSFSKIKPFIKNIKILLLSHQHGDHLNKKTIRRLLYEKPNIMIICGEWLIKILVDIGINKRNIYPIKLNKKYDLGKYIIEPVPAIHDVDNCGYKILIKNTNFKIFHITDTASLKGIEAKNYDLYCIENNYSKEELENRIREKEELGEFAYEYRVKETHLSAEEVNSFLIEMMGNNSKFVYCHQHKNKEENKNEGN